MTNIEEDTPTDEIPLCPGGVINDDHFCPVHDTHHRPAQPTLFEVGSEWSEALDLRHPVKPDTAKPLGEVVAAVATTADSSQWATVLVNRVADEIEQLEAAAQRRRDELDRWFTVRVTDAFETFSGDVLAGVLYQLTTACEVGLDTIDNQVVEAIARRAVLA